MILIRREKIAGCFYTAARERGRKAAILDSRRAGNDMPDYFTVASQVFARVEADSTFP